MIKTNTYKTEKISELLRGNSYVGRGIVTGESEDGKCAAVAYFIMGRSANSRNRIFTEKNGEVFTEPFDASKVEDPSLIIYAAVRSFSNNLVVTNGDQTDTICDFLRVGKTFEEALNTREFEPDMPNFTPRISTVLTFDCSSFKYKQNILKSGDEKGSLCNRFTFSYTPAPGVGHFIHTYVCNGTPLPTFCGEPERVKIPADIDAFTDEIWNALDADNKISLYTRFVNLSDGTYTERLVNKNR